VDPGGQLFRISDFQDSCSFGTFARRLLGSRYCTRYCNVLSVSLQGRCRGQEDVRANKVMAYI
jgi:hypothetical protein